MGRKLAAPVMEPLVGTAPAALSSKVTVALAALTSAPSPPGSDSRTMLCPVGPTSRMSRSLATGWVSPTRVTLTSVTRPANPDTAMVDGYGLAGCTALTTVGLVMPIGDGLATPVTAARAGGAAITSSGRARTGAAAARSTAGGSHASCCPRFAPAACRTGPGTRSTDEGTSTGESS